MIFNPIRKELFTDSGEFIKKLHCPYRERWDSMTPLDSTSRLCSRCDHAVVDTSTVPDDVLLDMLHQNPNTCLKVDLNQHNLIVDYHARRPS